MRNSQFFDRCFVAVVLLALMAFFTAVGFSMADREPRTMATIFLLQTHR